MHVFVTGATGFVGTYVVRALLEAGHTVRALVRRGAEAKLDARDDARVEIATGDVLDPASLPPALAGCEAVVHLVGIIEEKPREGVTFQRLHVEATQHLVAAAQAAGIARFVHMSANGARADGVSAYQTTKWHAEEAVRTARFPHTVVFRPSILFGNPGPGRPEFCTQLWQTLIRPFPILPILGDGQYRLQPVHVSTVAAAFARAVTLDAANGQAYGVGGPEALTFVDVVDRITRGAGRPPKPKVYQPLWLAKLAVSTVGALGLLPITPAQFAMLLDGNTTDATRFNHTFPATPIPFVPENLHYVAEYS